MNERERGPIKVEIVEHFGVLSTAPTGWTKEFNLVKWNDRPEKYDIRDWSPGHERMSKGITLFDYEMKKIAELCAGIFAESSAGGRTAENGTPQAVVTEQQTAGAGSAQAALPDEQPAKVSEQEIPF